MSALGDDQLAQKWEVVGAPISITPNEPVPCAWGPIRRPALSRTASGAAMRIAGGRCVHRASPVRPQDS